MTEFAQVDVKEIECTVPRAHFTEAQIEQLADLILTGGGIRPLVVKQVDIDRYELLDGAFEYYGAIRAREKEPRQGEWVSAFVVSRKTEATIQQQIALLQGLVAPVTAVSNGTDTSALTGEEPTPNLPEGKAATTTLTSSEQTQLTGFISNFVISSEAQISAIREELFQSKRALESRIAQLEKRLADKAKQDLLHIINTLPESELMAQLTFYIDETRDVPRRSVLRMPRKRLGASRVILTS